MQDDKGAPQSTDWWQEWIVMIFGSWGAWRCWATDAIRKQETARAGTDR